jgi:hypothetical protein
MTVLADRTEPVFSWHAVVERGEPAGDGRPAPCGPMHAARRGSFTTACGQPIDTQSGRRALPQVAFATMRQRPWSVAPAGGPYGMTRTAARRRLSQTGGGGMPRVSAGNVAPV